MRDSILQTSLKGEILYGECDELLYLLEKLIDTERRVFNMCGGAKGSCKMEKRRQGLGYITVHARCDTAICNRDDEFRAHEFHWSRSVDVPKETVFAYATRKSDGKRQGLDGIYKNNILASCTHIHFSSNPKLAKNLLLNIAKVSGKK